MAKRGRLIVIEGIDGAGKTTQARLLFKRLRRERRNAKLIHFPQYRVNVFGRLLREFLDGKHGDPSSVDPYLASALYAADRFEAKEKLLSWLRDGAIVICDRYVSASLMHQGGKLRGSAERARFFTWLKEVEYRVFGLPKPDIIVYLSLASSLARGLLKKKDGVERSARYNRNSSEAGRELARKEKWTTIQCERRGAVLPREAIHERIYAALKGIYGR